MLMDSQFHGWCTYYFQVPKAVTSVTREAVNNVRNCHGIPAAPILQSKRKEHVSEIPSDCEDQDQ